MRTRRFILPLLAGLLVLVHSTAVRAQTPDPTLVDSQFPSLESAIRVKGPLTFCGEPVPLHLPEVREGLEKELLIMLWDRAQVILWLKRSARYFPYIQTALAGADMPDDLKYIAVIESALKPEAGSRRGARGIWQFIPSTARNHGLTVSRYIDERRNFYLATGAALRYFRVLHDRFSSWTLACAGYNMGEEGLDRRMGKQEVRDYYHLDLPRETERYIMRAVAAKLILSDPVRYGFRLIPADYYRPRKFDRVRLKHGHAAPVLIVAKAAGTYYKTVKELNPQLLSDVIPAGDNVVFLPEGTSNKFAKHYQPLIVQYRKEHRGKTYKVRRGDSLSLIADKNGLPLWKLLKLNNLSRNSVIQPGQKLVIMK